MARPFGNENKQPFVDLNISRLFLLEIDVEMSIRNVIPGKNTRPCLETRDKRLVAFFFLSQC